MRKTIRSLGLTVSVNMDEEEGKRGDYDLHKDYEVPDFLGPLVPNGYLERFIDEQGFLIRVERALYLFGQCALIGPTGTGKTHTVYAVAEKHKIPIFETNCSLQTSTYDLIGKYIGLGKENWVDGTVTTWCRHGGILYLDEANMMEQDIAARINSVMDLRGHIILTEKDNEVVRRHPMGYIVISMNPYSMEYAGTKPLNAAFRRRMRAWIVYDYLSSGDRLSKLEVNAVMERSSLERVDMVESIVKAGARLRELYKSGELPMAPSMENLVDWATLVTQGEDAVKAAEEVIINMTSDDEESQSLIRNVITSSLPLKHDK